MSDSTGNWSDYYDAVASRPPRDTLLKALALFDAGPDGSRFAIDLGCGSGADTREMLRRNWEVLAMDREPEAIRRLLIGVSPEGRRMLKTQMVAFEHVCELPSCDLINASFSLPFCASDHFDTLWGAIIAALRPRGRFAGTLFGVRDGRAGSENMTFHTREQVEAMLSPFKIEFLFEEERDGKTALGHSKHWHAFHIVARKS
jgi:SAM-dependent methyltransferase